MPHPPTDTLGSFLRLRRLLWAGVAVTTGLLWAVGCGEDDSPKVEELRVTPTPANMGGLFVSSGTPNDPIPEEVFSRPYVFGVSIRTTWELVEPAEGRFDWSYVDAQLAGAEAAGKQVILRVMAGVYTPRWVYDAGAESIALTVQNRQSRLFGQDFRIPLPWDAVLLDRWVRLVSALGERYGGREAVYAVSMAGPTGLTSEMILPKGEEAWTAAGYTDDKLIAAWTTTIDAYARAFPRTPLSLAVSAIPVSRYPGSTRPAQEVVSYGLAYYGSRFYLQGNWLGDTFPPEDESSGYAELYRLLSRASGRTAIGFQIDGRKLSGQTYDPIPGEEGLGDPVTDLGRALERALAAGASYVEVNERYFGEPAYDADLRRIALRLASTSPLTGQRQ